MTSTDIEKLENQISGLGETRQNFGIISGKFPTPSLGIPEYLVEWKAPQMDYFAQKCHAQYQARKES